MIKKIVIAGLIILGMLFFYKRFMADTMEPFFKDKKGNVDFFGLSSPDDKLKEAENY